MDKTTHLTTDDLILFLDWELDQKATSHAERHLLDCLDCSSRLQVLQQGSALYLSYHEQVLKPGLQVPLAGWSKFNDRLLPKKQRLGWRFYWAAAALAGISALLWFYFPTRGEAGAQEVLAKAVAAPEPAGEIVFTSGKYGFARPAVLEAGHSEARFQHVQALFVKAHYSWSNPLSARSFAAWRRQLPEKRDFVTAIRGAGGRQYYRVRTRTDAGNLHSASLTLEVATYRPTHASFEFQDEDLIEISERMDAPQNKPLDAQTAAPAPPLKTMETLAGPEDELRVFAALDAIGADAEEPIDVKLDAGHHSVLVTGLGMPASRRKQIETALAPLPNTVVRFSSGQALPPDPAVQGTIDAIPPNGSFPFREKLQDLAGGVRQLQTITDQCLETSNALFAHSHSLVVLAQEFPPPVEGALSAANANTLLALRQRRLGAMSYALRRLRDQLKPLLSQELNSSDAPAASSWQSTAENLYEAARNLDRVVSRLLAGSYDEQAGELMLKQLPDDLAKVDTLILADSR